MNGIIFQGKKTNVGCAAKFLFEPDVSPKSVKAIAAFSTGEKAYAEIIRETSPLVTVRIGEYYTGKGKRIGEQTCILTYNHELKTWQVSGSL